MTMANEITIKLTFSDADFDELDFASSVMGQSVDEIMATILGPELISAHVRDALAMLRREHEKLRRQHPEIARAYEVLAPIKSSPGRKRA